MTFNPADVIPPLPLHDPNGDALRAGHSLPKPPEGFVVSDAMKEAIRCELKRALETEITAVSIGRLIKLAMAARSMLRATRPGMPRGRGMMMHPYMGGQGMDEFLDEEEGPQGNGLGIDQGGGYMIQNPMSGSPYNETFGAQTIRECIAALPKLTQKPDPLPDLLEALRMAEEDKMPDVAAAVRAKIKERLLTATAPDEARMAAVMGDFSGPPAIDVAPGQDGG